MADKTLLVPGTQATSLRDQNGITVYNALKVSLGLQKKSLGGRGPAEWQDLLSLEYEPGKLEPTRTSMEPGTEITPGPVVMTPYDRLPGPPGTFPYDWRLDIRLNAQMLVAKLRNEKPATGRWNLIGHSQGGLVILLASHYTSDPEEFSRLVARVVLVGCPAAGTQRAVEPLVTGRGDFGQEPFLYDAAREMAQTWPAIYQMLPAWDSVRDPQENPLGPNKQVNTIGGYPGFWKDGMSEDHLSRARDTQQLLERPLSRFGPGVATLIIQGEKQDTPTFLTRDGRSLSTTGEKPGSRPGLAYGQTKGDTLVPSETSLSHLGPAYTGKTLRLAGKVKEHAFLCDGKFVVKKISKFLKEPAPAPPAPPTPGG